MITFTNLDSFVIKEREIVIRFKTYKLKSPTVKEWLIIQNLDFSELDNFRVTIKKLTNILIPTLTENIFNLLTNFELYDIACTCINSENQNKENNSSNKSDSNDDMKIAFDYLVIKVCRYLNMNLNEVLDLDFNIFLNVLKVLEVIKAEEALIYCELTHVVLENESGRKHYKEMLEKYRNTFENGVKTIKKANINELLKLKSMLEGGK